MVPSSWQNPGPFLVANDNRNEPRRTPGSVVPAGDLDPIAFGCGIVFIYYLRYQLGIPYRHICGAGGLLLSDRYGNLTRTDDNPVGDAADPFPAFDRLVRTALAGTSVDAVGINPFPFGIFSYRVNKNAFERDAVIDALETSMGTFSNVFELVLEGISHRTLIELAINAPVLSGPFSALSGIELRGGPPKFEHPSDAIIPQRILFPFDVVFRRSTLDEFPIVGDPRMATLNAVIRAGDHQLRGCSASAGFSLTTRLSSASSLRGGDDMAATARRPGILDVFWVGADGAIMTTYFSEGAPGGNWPDHSPRPITPAGAVRADSAQTQPWRASHADPGFSMYSGSAPTGQS